MTKRRIVISSIQLVLSLATLIVVSLAWFAISTEVQTTPIELNVGSGLIASYEIKFYTVDKVYKYDQNINDILVWNGVDAWVTPTYHDPELSTFPFSGIFLNQYDPLIDLNNVNNQLFIELKLVYDVDENSAISVDFDSDISLATDSLATFGYTTSRPYYLSEVLYIQQMESNAYAANPEGTNIFNQLKTDFNQVDINNDLIYPKYSFYTQINDPISQPETYYITSLSTPNINLTANQALSEVYLYFKFSYIDSMIEYIISNENVNIAINNGNGIIFFQDIKIGISEVSGV